MRDSRKYVSGRAMACLDLLAVACQHDHGELDFDDPRRSIDAVVAAAERLIENYEYEEGVAHLADMAANMLRIAVGEDNLDRVQEILDLERSYWSMWSTPTK